jgi:hypothetical protein
MILTDRAGTEVLFFQKRSPFKAFQYLIMCFARDSEARWVQILLKGES